MKCSSPIVIHGQAHACSRCLACRINRRRIWAHRLMLEGKCHTHNSFLTLTYSDENLPKTKSGNGYTLRRRDLQLFLKKLRRRIEPTRLRFFAAGEYGEKKGKPHYHLAIFGASSCRYGQSRYSKLHSTCCDWCELCRDCWGFGNIFNAELNHVTAAYICGYVIKKMRGHDTGKFVNRLLPGQEPEFSTQSNRPGIGAFFMDEVASTLLYAHDDIEDVPSSLNTDGKRHRPLGRYLRQQLRMKMGRDKAVPETVKEVISSEMQPLRAFAFDNSLSFADVVKEFYAPETTRLEALEEFNRKEKKL